MTGLVTDTDDHRLIRQSTAAIAARYGHGYYAGRARDGGHIAELWADLGQAGLLGVHLPAEYEGGGAGWPTNARRYCWWRGTTRSRAGSRCSWCPPMRPG